MPEHVRLEAGAGEVVVERHGGRVATLCPAAGLPNLLWRGQDMPFPGGDRLWPAPEMQIFYDADGTWRSPPELDPGDWTLDAGPDEVTLRHAWRGARFQRRVSALPAPPVECEMPWAGYTVADTVEGRDGWSAWHLVMVPAPASVRIRAGPDPVVYYPPAPPLRDGWLAATGAEPRWKLGFAPPADGRVLLAALGHADPGPVVVVLATADPDATYVDVQPSGGPATAVQVYDDGGAGFCELEHHAPLESPTLHATVLGAWGSRADRIDLIRRLEDAPCPFES